MASAGYPGRYEKGRPIDGIEAADALEGVVVFHAGTTMNGDTLTTSGGRVLGATALGPGLGAARERAYEAVSCIRWEGEFHRDDIALDAVRRLAERTGS